MLPWKVGVQLQIFNARPGQKGVFEAVQFYWRFLERVEEEEIQVVCPKECESTRFEFYAETTVPTKDVTLVHVFSVEFSYYNITQVEKIPSFVLVSSVAGALGLFVGIRFLRLVEFIEYFIEVFFVRVYFYLTQAT